MSREKPRENRSRTHVWVGIALAGVVASGWSVEAVANAALGGAVAWFVVYGLLVNVACVINGRWLMSAAPCVSPTDRARPRNFLFVVPTIGEASLESTLVSLSALHAPRDCRIEIIVVGTACQAASLISRLTPFYAGHGIKHPIRLLIDPDDSGGKPERLNFVTRSLHSTLDDFDYVVMVDSDTEVAAGLVNGLRDAASGVSRCEWPVALQPILVSGPGHRGKRAARAEAAMHTRWRLGYELTLLRLGHCAGRRVRRRWTPLSYAVGCCLAVRTDRARLGFPSPAEDLTLGYELAREDLAVAPVLSVAVTSTKATARDIAERHLAWFRFSRETLARSGPWRHRSGRRGRTLNAIERTRILGWVPGPLIYFATVALQLAAGPDVDALARTGLLLALAVGTYLSAGLSVMLAGPMYVRGWESRRVETVACCGARWVWSCAVPALLLLGSVLSQSATRHAGSRPRSVDLDQRAVPASTR